MRADIVQLRNNICANYTVYSIILARVILRLINHPSGVCIVQPVFHRRHVIQARARGDRFHCTAIRVAADHDIELRDDSRSSLSLEFLTVVIWE